MNNQANSGNRGFHTITCCPRADFVCIAENEIRLEIRNKKEPVCPMMEKLFRKIGIRHFVVPQRRKDCVILSDSGDSVAVPAFAPNAVDRVASGDWLLSVLSMPSYLNAPPELLGFIGTVTGALAI